MKDDVAILRVRSFFDWKAGKRRVSFKSKLKAAFSELNEEGIADLVIDLRGNGGGRAPWELYAYFVDEPFLFAKRADFIFSKKSSYYSNQKLHKNVQFLKRKWLNTWLPGANKMSLIDSNRYALTGLFMTKPYKPSSPQYKGNVYILIDGGTFSAAAIFAALMKSSGRATIIGEESGGGYYGNTSMEKSYVTLPNAQLRLEIPLVRYQLNVDPSKNPFGSGVLPDYEVLQTAQSIFDAHDYQLRWALAFIKKKSQFKKQLPQ